MNDYSNFDQLRTNELSVLRHGFFKSYFELTDGQFYYAKLSQLSIWKPIMLIETAQGSWVIKRKHLFSRTIFIQQPEDVIAGTVTPELLSRKINLTMNDGFEAKFLAKAFFTRTYTWVSDQYGDILEIKPSLWSWKNAFKVTINLNLLKDIPALPLLPLLGVNLILLKQSQAAAGAN